MSEFSKIFKKVDGKGILKQYAKSHVLAFALVQTALLGLSRKGLEIVRLAVGHKIYRRLKKQNAKFIENYKSQHKNDVLIRKKNQVIWTIWLQGMDKAPAIVQKCYESMKEHITGRDIVVITEDNYYKYVTFPGFIIEKYKKGIISKVHFADLLRIELLAMRGGTWLDGTVYCSGKPGEINQEYILDSELFLFQSLKPGLDGHSTAISSWLMTAYTGSNIILLTRALLHNYWKNHDYAVDYFILHNFFQMAIEAYPQEWNQVVPFSNSSPHILLLRLFDQYDEKVWNAVKRQSCFHKLSYKFDTGKFKLKGTYYDAILGGNASDETEEK